MIELELRMSGRVFPFRGPLDLLLALARREGAPGIPWDRLPIARITGEFLRTLAALRAELTDFENGEEAELLSDFIETASWLALLKSRALLPPVSGELEAESPEQELGRVLLSRAALQASAALLGERLQATGLACGGPNRFKPNPEPASPQNSKPPEQNPKPAAAPAPAPPTAGDVVVAARRALDALRARPGADPYPANAALALLAGRLAGLAPGEAASTEPWFKSVSAPEAQAALLLALLELARTGRVLLHQPRHGGTVWLKRVGDGPLLNFSHGLIHGAAPPP